METIAISHVVPVALWGVAPRDLVLDWRPGDPAAVRLEVEGRSWHVARQCLVAALAPPCCGLGAVAGDEGAGAVMVSRLPGVCAGFVRVMLRTPSGACWPLAVSAGVLAEFLVQTFRACSVRQEQALVERELSAQLELIAVTGRLR